MKDVYLKKWFYDNNYIPDSVYLVFQDNSSLSISREAFNRSFQPIITSCKSVILRDFKKYIR